MACGDNNKNKLYADDQETKKQELEVKEAEIEKAQNTPLKSLKDPETDQERFAINPEYLVVVGVCTHLGCIPNERKNMAAADGDGWLCACHGSIYDTSGRIVSGPAPTNLPVPPYTLSNTTLKIG